MSKMLTCWFKSSTYGSRGTVRPLFFENSGLRLCSGPTVAEPVQVPYDVIIPERVEISVPHEVITTRDVPVPHEVITTRDVPVPHEVITTRDVPVPQEVITTRDIPVPHEVSKTV